MSQASGRPDAIALASMVRAGTASATDIIEATLSRIDRVNPAINAFVQVFHDESRLAARAIDDRRRAGQPLPPLAGVPVAIKDNICLAWGNTTCASRLLENYQSPFTATCAQKLIDAGAIVVGKTNLDEFAMGSTCEFSVHGPTRNPWHADHVAGGSSGGSAAAVAAGLVPIALGSDTGGSIRQPASHCGVFGLKPTYGRVSRYGLVAYASSLDQVGAIAGSLDDLMLATRTISGVDENDATSVRRGWEEDARPSGFRQFRVRVPDFASSRALSPSIASALSGAMDALRDVGADVGECRLPNADAGIAAYYIIACAEASSNLARYDGIRYGRRGDVAEGASLEDVYVQSRSQGFGEEVKRRLLLGAYALSAGYYDAYYSTALRARSLIRQDFERAFDGGVDAVLLPCAPGPAPRLGVVRDDPLSLYLDDLFTVGANLAGLPALAVPVLTSEPEGLPVGVQLIGPPWSEARLVELAGVLIAALPASPMPAIPRGGVGL